MVVSRNSRYSDDVRQALSACLQRHLQPTHALLVGYSGGLDSTALLHAAATLAPSLRFSLSAIHVHHGLSPNADAWAAHCERFCARLGTPLLVVRVAVDNTHGQGLEAAARSARYRAMLSQPAQRIALAHHADDQAETLLHNLLRGCGLRGAAAMPEIRRRILRPFLDQPRQALLDYAKQQELNWIEDESNEDSAYTRNYLRNEVMPSIQARFAQSGRSMARAARHFAEAQTLLDELAVIDLHGHPAQFPLSTGLLRPLSTPRVKNLLRSLLTWQELQAPDERRLNEFVRQLISAAPDRHPRLHAANYQLRYARGAIHLTTDNAADSTIDD